MAKTTLGLAATAALTALPAFAQDADVTELDPITVKGEDALTTEVETISSEEIQQYGATDARTLFQITPNVQTSGTTSSANKIFINGIETNAASVTVDGASTGTQAFHHAGPGGFNPKLFKQVDIYAGITPADIGPFATAGALVFTTVDAGDLLLPGQTVGGSVELGYESNGNIWSGYGTVYGKADRFDYLLSFGTADGDDWEDGDGNTVQFSNTDTDSGLINLGYDLNEGRRIKFSSTYNRDTGVRNLRGDIAYGVPGELVAVPTDIDTRTYTLEYTDDQIDGFLNPEARVTYTDQSQFHDRESNPLVASYDNLDIDYDATTIKLQNRAAFNQGEVRFGYDYIDSSSDNKTTGLGETIKNSGIFVQADADITSAARVSGGLRYDWTDFDGHEGSGFSTSDDGYSANIYGEYDVNPWLTLDAGASRVFGGYDFSETALLFDPAQTYTDGPAETSKNYRIGFNVAFVNGFFGGAHVFRTKIEDAADTRSLTLGGKTIESEGWDAQLGYRYGKGQLVLNYIDADVRKNGELITGYADYSGAPVGQIFVLRGDYDFGNGLVVGALAEVTLDYDVGSRTLPGYEVVNLFATYTPQGLDGLTIRLGIDNAFNEEYTSRQSRDTDDEFLFREPGRSVDLSMIYTF